MIIGNLIITFNNITKLIDKNCFLYGNSCVFRFNIIYTHFTELYSYESQVAVKFVYI